MLIVLLTFIILDTVVKFNLGEATFTNSRGGPFLWAVPLTPILHFTSLIFAFANMFCAHTDYMPPAFVPPGLEAVQKSSAEQSHSLVTLQRKEEPHGYLFLIAMGDAVFFISNLPHNSLEVKVFGRDKSGNSDIKRLHYNRVITNPLSDCNAPVECKAVECPIRRSLTSNWDPASFPH